MNFKALLVILFFVALIAARYVPGTGLTSYTNA